MAQPLVSDALWTIIEPHIPVKKRRTRNPGRKPVPDRAVLAGILFVLRSGIPWEMLPQEMGCGCGMTCWRRLRDWKAAGVWDTVHHVLLNQLRRVDAIDFQRALVDSGTVRAVGGGQHTGPSPVDRRKPGSKHHILTDGQGVPIVAKTTAANRHDVTELLNLVNEVPAISGKRGAPRYRFAELYADRAYDCEADRQALRQIGTKPMIPKRRTENGSGLGKIRWAVERTISWLHQFRRLRIRYERRIDIHEAFLTIGCILICHRILERSLC